MSELSRKARSERRQRGAHAAAGTQKLRPLVRDDDARRVPRFKMPFDLISKVMDVDHCGADAGFRELVQHVVDQRLAGDRHKRLRHAVGNRPHAGAETGGKNHGVVGRSSGGLANHLE